MTVERLCTHIIRLLHAPIRIYDTAGNQTAVYVDCGEQQDVLACDSDLLALLMNKRQIEYPVLHLEAEEIVYGIITSEENVYILGPCCLGLSPAAAARYLVRKHHMDAKRPYRIPGSTLEHFSELLLLLFETVTGKAMAVNELYMRCFCGPQFERAMEEKMHQVFFELQESAAVHNPYDQELREQDSIRTGDLDALNRSFQEAYVGKLGTLAHDPLRQEKNIAVVVITLATRSAIAGGLLPEVAFSMSDAFIQRVEDLKNVGEVSALTRQAEIQYCKAVRELSASSQRNSLVNRCKELVVRQLHSKLSVQELAQQLVVTPDYLSHLFIKEEGIKLTDYIAREKITFAKRQLAYTSDSYGAVAFSLGFSSQSHFGKTFKKWVGITPKQYREQYGKRPEK